MNGNGRVDRAPDLRRRALEVDDHPVAGDGDRDGDRDRVRIEAVLVDVVRERVDPVGHRGDRVAGETLGLVEQRCARGGQVGDAVALDEREIAALAGEARRDLGTDVAEDDVGNADVLLEHVEDGLVRSPCLEQLDRRDAQSLLEDLGRVRAVAARGLAADVGLVADADRPADALVRDEDRLEQVEVRQVRPALVRVVEQELVAGRDPAVELADDLGDRVRDRPRWSGRVSPCAMSRPCASHSAEDMSMAVLMLVE